MIPKITSIGLVSERSFDRMLQAVHTAKYRLSHRAFLMHHHDGLATVSARLDQAAFVAISGRLTVCAAKVHIDAADTITVAVQLGTDHNLNFRGKIFVILNSSICTNLDQHKYLRRQIARKALALFNAMLLEEAFVCRALFYSSGLSACLIESFY